MMSDAEVVNILRAILETTGKEDSAGRQAFYSLFGDQHVSTRRNQINLNFEYSVSELAVDTLEQNGATVIHEQSHAEVGSGTQADGFAQMESIDNTRYISGLEVYGLFAVRFDPPEKGNIQRVGLFDDGTGFWFGFNGREFSVADRAGGEDVIIGRGEFSEDDLTGEGESEIDLDATKYNLFRIVSGSLGTSAVYFDIYSGFERGWVTFHIRPLSDIQKEVTIPNLPIRVESLNTETLTETRDVEMVFASAGVSGETTASPSDRPFTESRTFTLNTTGSLRNAFTLKNKEEFQGKVNRVRAIVKLFTASTEGTQPVEFQLLDGATLGGNPTFTDVDTEDSAMEVSDDDVSVSGGRILFPIQLQKADAETIELPAADETGAVIIHPGEQLTVAVESSNATDLIVALRWTEQF